MGHVLMENRNGLAVAVKVMSRRRLAPLNVRRLSTSSTVIGRADGGSWSAATRGSMSKALVQALRERKVTPHIAIDGHLSKTGKRRKTAIDDRTYATSATISVSAAANGIEEVFGWTKTTGGGSGQGSRPGQGPGRLHLRDPGLQSGKNTKNFWQLRHDQTRQSDGSKSSDRIRSNRHQSAQRQNARSSAAC